MSPIFRIHSPWFAVSLPLSGISDSVVDSVDRLEYLLRILNPFPSWNTLFTLSVQMASPHVFHSQCYFVIFCFNHF